jgi:hypothetical protein
MTENGIANPEDFRQAFEKRGEFVRLALPKCGLRVQARRLSELRVLLMGQKIDGIGGLTDTAARNTQYAELMLATIQEVLVRPRLSLNPGPEEIDPNWVPLEDGTFLFNWGMGLVADDGTSLIEFFRGEQRPAAQTGAGGRDVPREAERVSGPAGAGSPTV